MNSFKLSRNSTKESESLSIFSVTVTHFPKILCIIAYVILCSCSSSAEQSTMPSTAKWNGVVLAESSDIVEVEGNKYFPMSSLKMDYFKKNGQTSNCPWKGTANYFDIVVDGKTNAGAAWYYASPKPAAANIKDRVAFWKGVNVS